MGSPWLVQGSWGKAHGLFPMSRALFGHELTLGHFKGKMGSPRLVQGSWGKAHEPSPIWARADSSLGSAHANPTPASLSRR